MTDPMRLLMLTQQTKDNEKLIILNLKFAMGK